MSINILLSYLYLYQFIYKNKSIDSFDSGVWTMMALHVSERWNKAPAIVVVLAVAAPLLMPRCRVGSL
jgi:hypothetical protein